MKHKKFRIGRWIAGALSGILLFSCVQARRVEDESEISSREYAISAFIEAAGIPGLEDSSVLSAYSDADQVSPSCQPYLAAAVEAGLIRGFEDHTLRPQTPIRRIEAFIILR